MSYWTWNNDLNLGIDLIDSQHQRIAQYLNELHAAKEQGDRRKVGEILDWLLDYTESHFLYEEDLMKRSGYMLSEAHKSVHTSFIERMKRYQTRFRNNEDIAHSMLTDLHKSLTNHIKSDDRDYARNVSRITQGGWLKRTVGKVLG